MAVFNVNYSEINLFLSADISLQHMAAKLVQGEL